VERPEDNPYWILDVADIVLIDPVGTGFSRPMGNGRLKVGFALGPALLLGIGTLPLS
jgi:hypothetical protein